jgi:hypothetical protein
MKASFLWISGYEIRKVAHPMGSRGSYPGDKAARE